MSRVVISLANGRRFPRVVADLAGDDTLTGGVGGWETLDRPRRTTAIAWVGTPAVTWTVPLMLDGVDTNTSVDRDVERLTAWGTPGPRDTQPPTLLVQARDGRARATARWVIADIEWGEQERTPAGVRVRQELTLSLLEYVPGRIYKGPAAKARGGKAAKKHKWVRIGPKDRRCKVCKKPRDDKRHTNRSKK